MDPLAPPPVSQVRTKTQANTTLTPLLYLSSCISKTPVSHQSITPSSSSSPCHPSQPPQPNPPRTPQPTRPTQLTPLHCPSLEDPSSTKTSRPLTRTLTSCTGSPTPPSSTWTCPFTSISSAGAWTTATQPQSTDSDTASAHRWRGIIATG